MSFCVASLKKSLLWLSSYVFKIMEELSVGAQEQTEALRERIELLEQEKSQMEVELTRLKSRAQGS
jgi:uncharacterized protein (UPF0335 family)